MKVIIRSAIFILIGIFTTSFSVAAAQNSTAPIGESVEQHNDFTIQTNIGLGLNGIHKSTHYKLIDELGLEFDIGSLLLKPGMTKRVGIDEEQYRRMRNAALDAEEEMNKIFVNVVTEEGREKIESMFMSLQDDLYEMMDEEQIEKLHTARNEIGVEEYGLEYFASSQVRDQTGLSEEQAKSIAKVSEDSKARLIESIKDLTKQANEAVLEQVDSTQLRRLEQILDSDSRTKLTSSDLFKPKKTLKDKASRNYATLVGLTRIASVRKQLKMDDSQTETIKLLKRHARKTDDAEIKTSVEETLKPDQIQILVELTFENQFEEFGTINAICFGIVAEQIGLSKEQANRLFEIGTEINEELADDIHQAKVDFLKDAFGSLDDEQVEQVIRIAGRSDFLKTKE